jgi:hypothetical protein
VTKRRPTQRRPRWKHSSEALATREDRQLLIFNPGSIGPRRVTLPITFGVLDIGPDGIVPRHMSCETGQPWLPG